MRVYSSRNEPPKQTLQIESRVHWTKDDHYPLYALDSHFVITHHIPLHTEILSLPCRASIKSEQCESSSSLSEDPSDEGTTIKTANSREKRATKQTVIQLPYQPKEKQTDG